MLRSRNLLSRMKERNVRVNPKQYGPRPRGRRCLLESLEPRVVLSAGIATTAFSSTIGDRIAAGLVVNDTKFVAVGRSGADSAIFCYNANGSLDTSFGAGGVTITPFSTTVNDYATSLAQTAEGSFVMGGTVPESALAQANDFALARYSSTGILDTTFGTKGKVRTNFGQNELLRGIVVLKDTVTLSDDSQVPAGTIYAGGNGDGVELLVRYTSAGRLDTSFGNAGRVELSRTGEVFGMSLWEDPTSGTPKIVQAGWSTSEVGHSDFRLVRYTLDGTLDTNFGGTGVVTTHLPESGQWHAVTVDGQGRILVAGYLGNDFAVARYLGTGAVDSTFGTEGIVRTKFGGSGAIADAIQLSGDGRIAVAGRIECIGFEGLLRSQLAVAVYDSSGKILGSDSSSIGIESRAWATGFLGGQVIAAGYVQTMTATGSRPSVGAVTRYTPTGELDTAFGPPTSVSISDVSKAEGNSGTTSFDFTVSLASISAAKVSVQYRTLAGSATETSDYLPTSGTITIPAGILTATMTGISGSTVVAPITVSVVGDTVKESNETFSVELSNASGASIADSLGIGTIVNDDGKVRTTGLSVYASRAAAGRARARAALINAVARDQLLRSRESLMNNTKKKAALVDQAMLDL